MYISTEQIIRSLCAGFNNRFISHGFFDSGARSIIEDRQEIAQLADEDRSIIEQEALTPTLSQRAREYMSGCLETIWDLTHIQHLV